MLNPNDFNNSGPKFRPVVAILLMSALLIGGISFWLIFQSNEADPYSEPGVPQITKVTLDGNAMEPTLPKGATANFEPQPSYNRGDIVWLNDPKEGPTVRHVRRIVAVGGDSIKTTGGTLYINGVPVKEPYLKVGQPSADFGPVSIGTGQVYVLGDNRENSQDSREWGAIALKLVRGSLVK